MQKIVPLAFLKIIIVIILVATASIPESVTTAQSQPRATQAVQTPVLKWEYAGCYSSWCETSWYSSPAAADLDGDGQIEVVASAYSIVALNGDTGTLEWRVSSGHDRSESGSSSVGRTWPGIVIADIDKDGAWEIITAHSGGYVSVYTASGYFEDGWPQHPITNEFRGLSVYDLDGDGKMEIIVTGAIGSETNTWVYQTDGTLRSGWPQLSNDTGYAWGVYNDNSAIGDINDDGRAEIIVPSDVHYINAYTDSGVQIQANSEFGDKGWGKVGVWESTVPELRGWGSCTSGNRTESYRANFASGPSLISDLNGDGTVEVATVGNVYDCSTDDYESKYYGLFLFNPDRSRFSSGGYDWSSPTLDTGAPLVTTSPGYDTIESAQPNLAAADLDGDGEKEILFPSYDGKLHVFWLDHTEHGSWPFWANPTDEDGFHYASEPVVADLDGDGSAEVILTTWSQKEKYHTGRLIILNSQGVILQSVELPDAYGSATWNGALPAPTLANLDDDDDLEIIINTAHSGFVAYDLPGTSQARILWGTGRGTSLRSGSFPINFLSRSSLSTLETNSSTQITLTIDSILSDQISASAVLTLSGELDYTGGLTASSGSVSINNDVISWEGQLSGDAPAVIQFNAELTSPTSEPVVVYNDLHIEDAYGGITELQPKVIINRYGTYLPGINR